MKRQTRRLALVTGAACTVVALSATAALADGPGTARTGPTTGVTPYVLPVADGVDIASLVTVGDKPAGNGYRMVGIPDGIGALPSGRRTVDVLMNHELPAGSGVVRDHGRKGAFVSRLTVDPRSGAVLAGDDLIKTVQYWQYAAGQYGPAPAPPTGSTQTPEFGRFCSGALTAPGQLLNRRSGNGYDGQLYFANEENGNDGRAFAVGLDGTATQLPRLGLLSWENTLAAANRSDTTVVMSNEDSADGQVRVYRGTKTNSGSAADRAGLTNGALSVIDAVDEKVNTDADFRATYGKNNPAAVDLSGIDWNQSGTAQNTEAKAGGLSLNRIEDGAFDPKHPGDYYFNTTEGGDQTPHPEVGGDVRNGGGLWRLSFTDIERPELGGTLTLLLDGSEAPFLNKPDNMTIDDRGNLLLQEDPGNNASVARIVAYRIADGALGVLAQFDAARFGAPATGQPSFITQDEESSGILDVSGVLGRPGTFVFDAQVHKPNPDPELVEEGQLLTMTVSNWDRVYGTGGHGHGDGHGRND
ncbi:MAG: PhoX family protein [Blastococcus sp.]|nr:PhoX family protein [Blastococcus sp.]